MADRYKLKHSSDSWHVLARKGVGAATDAAWVTIGGCPMWQQIYKRHVEQIERDEGQADYLFLSKFAHLLSPADRDLLF